MFENSQWDPNAPIICPYDETHVIAVKRFQRHLVKCRKNHPDKDFVTCPFNARHAFLRCEMQKHLAFCPDRISLDADVLQEEDPETGDMLRLKGKTDMPKPLDNIPEPSEDWDDEIEENIAAKCEEHEEYLRAQKVDEEPLLRRPILPIVNNPHLPTLNQPVYDNNGPLTSLRRPNIPTADNTAAENHNNDNISLNTPMTAKMGLSSQSSSTESDSDHSSGTRLFLNQTKPKNEDNKDGVISNPERGYGCNTENNTNTKIENNKIPKSEIHHPRGVPMSLRDKMILGKGTRSENSVREFSDTESVLSDSSWVSSIYEPIKRNRMFMKPNNESSSRESSPYSENMTLDTTSQPPSQNTSTQNDSTSHCNSTVGMKPMQGVGRGNSSAFTTVVVPNNDTNILRCKPPVLGRGVIGLQKNSLNLSGGKGLGRGNLKLAAINFKTASPTPSSSSS